MGKTNLSFYGVISTDAPKEVFKTVEKFIAAAKEAGIENFHFSTNSYNEAHDATLGNLATGAGGAGDGGGGGNGRGRVGRSEAGERAAADFAEAGEAEGGDAAGTDAPAGGKRRGRPPGSGKRAAEAGSGSAAGKRDDDGKQAGGAAEGTGGNEPVGTRQGAGQGAGQGQGGRGGAGGGGDDQRGNRQAPRISSGEDRGEAEGWDDGDGGTSDDEWDDAAPTDDKPADYWAAMSAGNAWPDDLMPEGEITKETLSELLAAHFNSTGGKDREPTFALMQETVGERSIKNVDPKNYDKLARALLKDTAKYTYGIKKPK